MNKTILAGIATLLMVTGASGVSIAAAQSASGDVKNVKMGEFWTGVPSDDEQVGKYDGDTGLGTFVDCSDAPDQSGKHALRVQFSYSRTAQPVPFYADIMPDKSREPSPAFHYVLDADHTSVTYTTEIASCDDKYTLFVGYPK